jgi:putative membrane protein
MKGLLLRWLILTLAVLAAAYLLRGIEVKSFGAALAAAAILGILNAFLRPLLLLFTLPLNILTLGLFTFVVNALMLLLTDKLSDGLQVEGFWAALLGALVISAVSWLISALIGSKGRVEVIELHHRKGDRWE